MKTKVPFSKKVARFFKHYFGLLLLAIVCGVLTVFLVGFLNV